MFLIINNLFDIYKQIIVLAYPKTRKLKARKRKKIFKNENAETEKNFEILKF